MDLGLGTFIWSPLAGGFLSGKYTRDGEAEAGADEPDARASRRVAHQPRRQSRR